MKSIRYSLLISIVICFSALSKAQTKPSDSTKVKKSSPVPAKPVTPPPGGSQPVKPSNTNGTKKSAPVKPQPRISSQGTNNLNNNDKSGTVTPANTTTTKDPNERVSNAMFNISLITGIPRGDFHTNTNGAMGWGLEASLLFNLGGKRTKKDWEHLPVNFYMGGAFQYMRLRGKTDSYSYNDQFSETTIDSKVNNNMLGIGFLTRVEFFSGPVKPFLEATAGVRFFTGSHRVDYRNELTYSNDPNDTRTQSFSNNLEVSVVGYYGAGGGFRVGSETVRVEAKLMYTVGSTAEYVDLDKIQFDRTDNSITYTTKQSTTNLLVPQLGLSLIF